MDEEEYLEARLVNEACEGHLGLLARAEEGIGRKVGARAMARLCEPELQAIEDIRRRVAVAIRAACGDCGIDAPSEKVEGAGAGAGSRSLERDLTWATAEKVF